MSKITLFEVWTWRLWALLAIAGVPQHIWKERGLDEIYPSLCPECQQEIRKVQNNE